MKRRLSLEASIGCALTMLLWTSLALFPAWFETGGGSWREGCGPLAQTGILHAALGVLSLGVSVLIFPRVAWVCAATLPFGALLLFSRCFISDHDLAFCGVFLLISFISVGILTALALFRNQSQKRRESVRSGSLFLRTVLSCLFWTVLAAALFLHGMAWLSLGWSSKGTLVKGDNFQGIIMDRPLRYRPAKTVKTWPIREADIQILEHDLEKYLAADPDRYGHITAELPAYYRQYHAVQKDGRRLICVDFFHHRVISRFGWLHRTFLIDGGGYLIWWITYDPTNGSFSRFGTNFAM